MPAGAAVLESLLATIAPLASLDQPAARCPTCRSAIPPTWHLPGPAPAGAAITLLSLNVACLVAYFVM